MAATKIVYTGNTSSILVRDLHSGFKAIEEMLPSAPSLVFGPILFLPLLPCFIGDVACLRFYLG